ncbi:hypothetical protein NKI20_29360 [Mesorhizobium sp. M0830]|uniref:hypothetical protein n=1 Tax=Mesorhizobium sp. M0830 TaxID=2957008 RepID=UPI0033380297
MSRPEVLLIKCYRQNYDDVGLPDVPQPGSPLEEAKQVATERLFNHFKSDIFRRGRQPHTADLVGEDGRIVARFQVRAKSSGGEEVIEVPLPSQPQ